jgi:mono/diheme cytochrome c family protein
MNRIVRGVLILLPLLGSCGREDAPAPAAPAAKGPPPAPTLSGGQNYQKMCASCHGANGEGGKDYPEPLVGDRTLEKLAVYVRKKMPEDKPGILSADEAQRVSAYIFDAFYSKAAQARREPPRMELSRLTVGQYKTSVADLMSLFSNPQPADAKPGLRQELFNAGRRFREDKRVSDKVVPTLQYDPGEKPPAEVATLEEYAVRWSGGLVAPETGDYEIILETRNGARIWVNDETTPLVDGWVRSGDAIVLKQTLPLLGGRIYPIRIEIFKEKKERIVAAALKWKAPHRVEEIIPERRLRAGKFTETMVVRTPFPPDDRSMGYERGTSISKAWDEATTDAAVEVAVAMAPRLAKTEPQVRARKLVERAFRRPLTPELQQFFVDRIFAETKDVELALKSVIILALKSPRFLYLPHETGDAYDAATRLSYALWDSLPDVPLLEAAKAGTLDPAKEAGRMLGDPRAKAKIAGFYHRWLQLDRLHDLAKDPKSYPGFDAGIVSDLRTSLDLFLDDVTWGEKSDWRQLLLADSVHMNGRLAKFYGVELPADAPFQKVKMDPKKHAGLLTHPLLMAGFSYTSVSSPIHRGVFLARALLGRRLRAPPDAVTPIPPELHPSLTTRERILLQTKGPDCQSCHAMINPLGFALENFDAVGRFREVEKEKPINAQGSYWTLGGEDVKFNGARELGEFLARSEESHEAFVEHLFHYLVKQPILAHGLNRPDVLREGFAKSGYDIRKLLIQEVAAAARLGGVKNPVERKTP